MSLTATEEALVRELLAEQAAILSLAGSESTIISKLGATKVTLADLTSASSAADADLMLIRQGATEKSITPAVLVPDASETVKGKIELATNDEVATGTDTIRAVTPAGRRSDTATSASDPTFVDSSTKSASTNWIRGAMLNIATAAGFVISLAANGYIKFPSWLGGLVIQWGNQIVSNVQTSYSYPIAFPTASLKIVLTDGDAGVAGQTFGANIVSATQYSAISSGASILASYIAIGY